MREWIGERVIQNLMTYSYTIKNKDFELTVKIPANDIADDQLGIYNPIVSEMGLATKTHPDELIFNLLGQGFTNNGSSSNILSKPASPLFQIVGLRVFFILQKC